MLLSIRNRLGMLRFNPAAQMETSLFRFVMTAFYVYLTSAEVSLVGVLSRSNFIINLIFYEVLFALFISDPVFETTKDDGIFFSNFLTSRIDDYCLTWPKRR